MAEINLPVSILYSENAGTKPQASNVDVGSLWINLADGCFGSKNSAGAIVSYGLLTEAERTQALADVTWGSITGDITQQADLKTQLDAKANLSGADFTGAVSVNGQALLTKAEADSTYITISDDLTATNLTVTGTLTANLTGNADTASALQTARTISASGDATWSVSFNGSQNADGTLTLANSGVVAGSYGQPTASTVSYGQTFNVPYVTVDQKGRVTAATTNTITLPQAPTDITGNAATATALQNVRYLSGMAFNGNDNVTWYTTCSSAIDEVNKTASITHWGLYVGSVCIVTFVNGNSAANPTLNINEDDARPIMNTGTPLGNVPAGATLMLVYDGTYYQVVGGVGSIDYSQYYTKAEMDAKFLPIMKPSAKGTVSIYAQTEPEAEPVMTAYNAAKESAAQNTGGLNCYTKEETDALFATIVNPVIIDTLTVEDEEVA